MDFVQELFKKESTKRLIFFFGIVLIIYSIRAFLNLLLMTFVFTFLINSLQSSIINRFNIKNKWFEKVVTLSIFSVLGLAIFLLVYKYLPMFVNQTVTFLNQFSELKLHLTSNSEVVQKYINPIIQQTDIRNYLKTGVNTTFMFAARFTKLTFHLFIAFMLSLFFMLEKKKIITFMQKFEDSKISIMYKYFSSFGESFLNSFGKVIQAQIIVAIVNTAITIVFLWIMKFPELVSLAIMIFLLSMIPVLGVLISLVPLCIIAFKIGGISKVISILIMVVIVHAFITYFVFPKCMSSKIELPIFIIFIILILSEYFIGAWGLLIGIPIVMFILDLLDVKVT